MKTKILLSLCIFTLVACAIRKNLETPFVNPVNKPVHDGDGDPTKGTLYCSPDANGKFDPSGTRVNVTMDTDRPQSVIAEGGGCVLRPIREVWAALNNLEEIRWQDTDSFEATRTINPEPTFTHRYDVKYFKDTHFPGIGVIDWTIRWFHGFDEGTFDAPQRVNIVYQKVSGTGNISRWEGAITLTRVNSQVTSIAMKDILRTRQGSTKDRPSASDAVTEMIRHARTAKPDYERLNDGLSNTPAPKPTPTPMPPGPTPAPTPNPPQKPMPPPENKIAYCSKDADGNYPRVPNVTATTDGGTSVISVKACVTAPIQTLFDASKNHAAIYWKNASRASARVDGVKLVVSYEKDSWFGLKKIRWTQDWTYSETLGRPPFGAAWTMDPVTTDFPVWNGDLSLVPVEAAVTEVTINNHLLLETVGDSAAQNRSVVLSLLNDLAGKKALEEKVSPELLPPMQQKASVDVAPIPPNQ